MDILNLRNDNQDKHGIMPIAFQTLLHTTKDMMPRTANTTSIPTRTTSPPNANVSPKLEELSAFNKKSITILYHKKALSSNYVNLTQSLLSYIFIYFLTSAPNLFQTLFITFSIKASAIM